MRISCPYCGERDAQEFVYRGDAAPRRPDGEAGFHDYVYLRDNRAGIMAEHWYHAQGCRTWIVVTRDTRTHEMLGSALASSWLQDGEGIR
ncbi:MULTISPECIES: sarcosine oxidase subunit delta [unclassified Sphingomonas]|uniref:sarcosine oxidase subunit delta n=1 Tax=unclassified Sphingomonas TaxID=196159 RepID=UPI0006F2323C|nr:MULTISPECIES: sarcosine oxidase subunit delta [unclassified Sphingomonas]KQX22602.1 sarcosine oxidase subunit delta [Sphingomonas sp. Root1294]KQY67920.1 sarcosine oxidase subunit delta [Sphingomonas sp. Root50]KRB88844.1 sarcosine oxidase subunit delta [Sphingomonas sp. Root720]